MGFTYGINGCVVVQGHIEGLKSSPAGREKLKAAMSQLLLYYTC